MVIFYAWSHLIDGQTGVPIYYMSHMQFHKGKKRSIFGRCECYLRGWVRIVPHVRKQALCPGYALYLR